MEETVEWIEFSFNIISTLTVTHLPPSPVRHGRIMKIAANKQAERKEKMTPTITNSETTITVSTKTRPNNAKQTYKRNSTATNKSNDVSTEIISIRTEDFLTTPLIQLLLNYPTGRHYPYTLIPTDIWGNVNDNSIVDNNNSDMEIAG